MASVDTSQLNVQSVNAQMIPDEGAKSIAVGLDFSTQTSYTLDLSNFIQRNRISLIQGLFMDNSAGSTTLEVSFPSTRSEHQNGTQSPRVPYRAVPEPSQRYFVHFNVGSSLTVILLNFPVTNADWPTITGA